MQLDEEAFGTTVGFKNIKWQKGKPGSCTVIDK